MKILTFIELYFDGNPMGWDGMGQAWTEIEWDGIEKYVPWTSLLINNNFYYSWKCIQFSGSTIICIKYYASLRLL